MKVDRFLSNRDKEKSNDSKDAKTEETKEVEVSLAELLKEEGAEDVEIEFFYNHKAIDINSCFEEISKEKPLDK